jgi:glycosyltransferase involved in cell wall biosynthesis
VHNYAELKDISNGRKDIIFFDGHLSHYENHALLELSDIYISLHRAEGYGLNLADAMARKTAVIATGYSGNLDFMDPESSVLVPYEMTPVSKYAGIRVASKWADPDLDFAAHNISKLEGDPGRLFSLAHQGYEKIKLENSLGTLVKKFQKEFMNA